MIAKRADTLLEYIICLFVTNYSQQFRLERLLSEVVSLRPQRATSFKPGPPLTLQRAILGVRLTDTPTFFESRSPAGHQPPSNETGETTR